MREALTRGWWRLAAAVLASAGILGAATRYDPGLLGFHILIAMAVVAAATLWAGALPGILVVLISGGLSFLAMLQDPRFGVLHDAGIAAALAVAGLVIVLLVSAWRTSQVLAERRSHQQSAVMELSRRALAQPTLVDLFQESCELVMRTLGVARVEIVEQRGEAPTVRARADRTRDRRPSGPPNGEEGRTPAAAHSGDPLTRVATVPIASTERGFGELEVYAAARRHLAAGDLDFLQAVSNLLAASMARADADRETESLRSGDVLLADVSTTLASSLDYDSRVRDLARVIVPRLADWCIIDLVEENGDLRRVAARHADPAGAALVEKVATVQGDDVHPEHPAMLALRDGQAHRIARIDEADLRRLAGDPGAADMLRLAGLRSMMAVPLRARGRTLGVVTLGAAQRAEYSPADLALAEEVAARAALSIDNARLYQKVLADDRAKDEFLAMLAHELRNPLAPMVHSLEVFRVASPDSEARERARRVLERQVTQLRHLVRDLLDVARITRGTIELKTQPVELGTAVNNAIESCQPVIEAHRHQLVTHLPTQPMWLDADPVRLEQILTNLINNSVEHSRPGTRTDLFAERNGDFVVLRFSDNGSGLSAQALEHIFDLYTRGDLMESGPGTGIGLHLVRRLAELHGGSVEARSEGVGKGSEFTVRLPTAVIVESLAPKAQPPAPAEEKPLRVLVVDDHMDSAAALAELLTLWGYQVRKAVDGREALMIAADFRPEVVLLDLAMPGMNGYEVAHAMRRMPELSGATLVALTGHARAPAHHTGPGYEFDHHWVKPLDPAALRAFVEERARHRGSPNAFAS